MTPKIGDAFAHGDAFHAECKTVAEFIDASVRPIVDRNAKRTAEHDTYVGALLRVTGWLRSLSKLNHPGDFQAIVSASRALFEIAVDLTLIVHDPTRHPHDRILAWEQSAKLKAAKRIEKFYADKKAPDEHLAAILFLSTQTAAVRALRQKHWPMNPVTRHPERWTNRSLEKDAEEADKFATHKFAEFYATRFAQLCWNTHGSGLAGVRMISEDNFPGVSAIALGECARFATIIAELTLRFFGACDTISEQRLKKLRSDRLAARARVLATYPDVWSGMFGLPK